MVMKLLEGKRGIITGALDENSIAWRVALKAHAHGARIVLSNAPVALRMGKVKELAAQCDTEVIPADATLLEDIRNLYQKAQEIAGGKLDFVLHSIGMSLNVRKGRPYTDLNYDFLFKTLDVSAISFHKMLQVAYQMDCINEWGSFTALTYIAAQRVFPDYGDMADAKALLESIARSFGYHYGKFRKVRVNTVSQSPTWTTAGSGVKGFADFYDFAQKMSPLGNAPADACADFCVFLFSDMARYITMQNLFHDGGFSNMGVDPSVILSPKEAS
ncbi:MAG: SDR family oxidoreductase [Flavobacteriales bacterium]|nr:SDR family oxidoreductase [Flavobacteriales bacterium]MCX7768114.1 SDR family oxidoreductase [Flavobacteriales bacterium]MDW8409594.1 SDR family oxidoreductase [Flavobacteriales bacterium]